VPDNSTPVGCLVEMNGAALRAPHDAGKNINPEKKEDRPGKQ
jgi:hypothetical protein